VALAASKQFSLGDIAIVSIKEASQFSLNSSTVALKWKLSCYSVDQQILLAWLVCKGVLWGFCTLV